MTLPIEAVETAGELAGAGAGAGESAGAARRSARGVTERTGVQPSKPKPKTPASNSSSPQSQRQGQGSAKGRRGAPIPGGRQIPLPKWSGGVKGGSTAHKLVVAEFVLCIVLIGVAPILSRQDQGNGHLYVANDLLRLSATCLLFFILALLSNQPRTSKFAAAFGGLVTLGAAFNASQAWAALAKIFSPTGAAS